MNGILSVNRSMGGTLSGSGGMGGSTSRSSYHPALRGRDEANQHPISAITSLEAELSGRPNEALTNLEIQAILDT